MRIKEIWKPISGYKNIYSISSFGRIRSERKDSSRTWIGRILKPQKQNGFVKNTIEILLMIKKNERKRLNLKIVASQLNHLHLM